jgi:hypothetical protein
MAIHLQAEGQRELRHHGNFSGPTSSTIRAAWLASSCATEVLTPKPLSIKTFISTSDEDGGDSVVHRRTAARTAPI